MMRLLSPLLSIVSSTETRQGIPAGQKWWSGAGSNRRPSAFQEALLIHVGPSLAAEQA
jgi:hypothetical protein